MKRLIIIVFIITVIAWTCRILMPESAIGHALVGVSIGVQAGVLLTIWFTTTLIKESKEVDKRK